MGLVRHLHGVLVVLEALEGHDTCRLEAHVQHNQQRAQDHLAWEGDDRNATAGDRKRCSGGATPHQEPDQENRSTSSARHDVDWCQAEEGDLDRACYILGEGDHSSLEADDRGVLVGPDVGCMVTAGAVDCKQTEASKPGGRSSCGTKAGRAAPGAARTKFERADFHHRAQVAAA